MHFANVTYNTDIYFTRAINSVCPARTLTYVVFMRNDGIACLKFAIDFIHQNDPTNKVTIWALPEGTPFKSQEIIMAFKGPDYIVMELEAQLLQLIGPNCVTALNAVFCNNVRNLFAEKWNRHVELYDFHIIIK